MLTLKNINLNYGKKIIFKNFSYDFKPNNIYHIDGQIGAGKSSLLDIISNFNDNYNGDIIIKDKKISKTFTHTYYSTSVSMNIEWMTLKKNISLINGDKKIIDDLIEQFDLKKYLNFFPNEISKGIHRKIDIIRMLSSQREIMLADDPFLLLDDISVAKISNSIYQYHNKFKNIIILAGNDERIKKIADVTIKL